MAKELTDIEIMQAAVAGAWPEEALPDGMNFECVPNTHHWLFDGTRIPDNYAAALFRDSGLAWLLDKYKQVRMYEATPEHPIHQMIVAAFNIVGGPTRLSAIDRAIQALTKKG